MIFGNRLKYFDWLFFASVILLTLVGLMMIYSTGLAGAGDGNLWVKQTLGLVLGLFGLFFLSTLDYRFLKKNSAAFYILAIVLLVGLFFLGTPIRNSQRWFDLGFLNFQPAELAKLAVIIMLAKFFQLKQPYLKKFTYILWSFVYVALPAALIIFQPDLGSAGVLVAIWLGMLVIAGASKRFLFYVLILFLILSAVMWQFLLADYQKDRLRSFAEPTSDPLGQGYNVIQSIVAVGSGGLFGRGLARGLQSQLRFLPERQTDFIFASTVEELGLLGGGFVLVLFVFMLVRIVQIVRGSSDLFGAYLAAGIFFLFLTQIAVNIGMNLGLLPVTGITLPFVSYGGSSLLINLWLVGIVESIRRHSLPVRFG